MLSSLHPMQARRPWSLARWSAAWLFGLALTLLVSCGGGGSNTAQNNNGGIGSGGTGSYTSGPVTGLGSIIVNGIRYALGTSTTIETDDDAAPAGASDDLKLGMLVEVQGSTVTPGVGGANAQASATKVRYASDLVGPLAVAGNGALSVLGQAVVSNAKTVLPTGATLATGDWVEIHGLPDVATNAYTATRIDRFASQPTRYKVAGLITAVTASTVTIGQTEPINITALRNGGGVPGGAVVGERARVWFGNTKVGGVWVASRMTLDTNLVSDTVYANREGRVTVLPDVYGVMRVDGKPVSVSRLDAGVLTGLNLALGDRLRVVGSLESGVLYATSMARETDTDVDDEDTELHGSISELTPQGGGPLLSTFKVRSVTVAVTSNTTREGGNALANGACVEVKGKAYDGAGRLIATQYEVADRCN